MRVRERACVRARAIVGAYSSSRNQEHSVKNRDTVQMFLQLFTFAVLSAAILLCACITPFDFEAAAATVKQQP